MIINSKHVGGGGADPIINPLTVNENGTYTAPAGVDGYSPVTVNVQGGAAPADAVVVTERNLNGYATKAEHYGNEIFPYQYAVNNNFGYPTLSELTVKTPITEIGTYAFYHSIISAITPTDWADNVTTIGGSAFRYAEIKVLNFPNVISFGGTTVFGNSTIEEIYLPKLKRLDTQSLFNSATSLKNLVVGSVDNGITNNAVNNTFQNVTQSDLTITLFTAGENADELLASVRAGATNATIIIKASEVTEYGGQSYSAGDTMITSTPV